MWGPKKSYEVVREDTGGGVSAMGEGCSVGFTFTAVIHSARSWGANDLHSRRTDGLEQCSCAVTDWPNRVAAARTNLAKR